MDRNLDIENFEQLLKEKTDEFKMYPAKRVWHSIYNNIHPGRKWPSIAMSITLITILLLAGYLNSSDKDLYTVADTHPSNTEALSFFNNPFLQTVSNNNLRITSTNLNTLTALNAVNYTLDKTAAANGKSSSPILIGHPVAKNLFSANSIVKATTANVNDLQNQQLLIAGKEVPITFTTSDNFLGTEKDNAVAKVYNAQKSVTKKDLRINENLLHSTVALSDNGITKVKNVNADDIDNDKTLLAEADNIDLSSFKKEGMDQLPVLLSEEDKAWIENYALYNRPAPKKWADKLFWHGYVTPSVVYVTLKNNMPGDLDISHFLSQHPSIGLEIGGGIVYSLSDKIKFKTGLQLNFTRYNTDGFENSHPVATAITMITPNGQYEILKTTPYSNYGGITPMKLHNQTFQVAIPVGFDLKLFGNENLQWNVGATIQPTYVFGGSSFLLSTDKRNFIKESSMINRFNLNAGFETFISYKAAKGIVLQFGPEFRRQLFTTNNKEYFLQEKLSTYGFKVGISKLIK